MEQRPDRPIGFVGLGNMGRHMARRLLERGYRLTVHDVRPEAMAPLVDAGARAVGSPAEVAADCDAVLVSLPTPPVVRAVALGPDGLLEGPAMRTYIDLSTTGPAVARTVAAAMAERGVTVLDAPVSGGVMGAEVGSLAVMVAGPPQELERYRALLEIIGKNVFYVGAEPGHGQAMKLLNNLLSASAVAITSEAMALGVKLGLDPDTMLDVLNASSGHNTATRDKFPRAVLTGTFDFGFDLALMCKDVTLCLEQADAAQVPMWVGHSVKQLWNFVEALTDGPADFTTLARHVESWAGVEVRSTAGGGAASDGPQPQGSRP